MMDIGLIYYLVGLSWLIHGVLTGWLRVRGDPVITSVWIILGAALWPWFLFKILRDLSQGREWTNLDEM